jgi:poly-gamma-glutamate capsule biosynthesis protein CapA/YwtB (metallophosphatase superfamily)
MESINIKIGGDFVVNKEDFFSRNIHEDVISLFQNSDLNILNLECPITTAGKEHQILKTGPHLKGNSSAVYEVAELLNINLLTLANNHILDYGEQGLKDTISFLKQNNFSFVGAGGILSEAKKVFRKNIKGKSFSVINFAENEWCSATSHSGGANPMNIIDNVHQIQEEKKVSDYVLVIIHGGHEYYNLPSPRMVQQYRFYAENGANAIIGHHTHCISGYEEYNGVPICYSLGNFLFTENSKYADWNIGLVAEIVIDTSSKISVNLHPIEYNNQSYSLNLLRGDSKTTILNRVKCYSEIIKDPKSIQKSWDSFLQKQSKLYLEMLSPIAQVKYRYLKGLLYKLKLSQKLISKKGFALILNLNRCEAHSDVVKEVMTKFINK